MSGGKQQKQDMDNLRARIRTPEQFAAMTEAVNQAQRDPGFFVLLGRQPELPTERNLKAFAEAMELDVYTARQRLLSPTARIIRREAAADTAQRWADWLSALGLRAFAISEQALAAQKFLAQSAVYMKDGSLVFDDLQGNRSTREASQAACLVFGEVMEKVISDKSQGGALFGEEKTGPSEPLNIRSELIIDIHFRNQPESMRLAQDAIHFRSIFPNEEGGSSVLTRRLLKRLERSLPGCRIYDEFKRAQDVLGTTEHVLAQSSSVVRNWLRPGLSARVERSTTRVLSTAETFDIYSTLARLETLRV